MSNEGLLAKRESWEGQAKCKDLSPSLFFNRENEDAARTICSSCEVQEQCLEFALEHNIQYGIWGGYDEAERKTLRRRLVRLRRRSIEPETEKESQEAKMA